MGAVDQLYQPSLSLLTDLYQLTMAHGYWKLGNADREAVFQLYFRQNPFGGGYAIACGLEDVVAFIEKLRFDQSDIAYIETLVGNDGCALFDRAFLEYLENLRFICDVDAVPEGTVVFANEPLVRVKGSLLQCQLLETPLLNLINFQTLIATKAARITQAAGGEAVLEFGLRRAQGIDGSLSASRAAYVGGCASTSNVLAGKLLGIPVRGTHAHSWVMSFEGEPEAFEAYAQAMPNNCVFLVDTYDTLEGVRRAAEVGRRLKDAGHRMIGIRLDSGDLAYLSIEARKILDEAGLPEAAIVASNDLDEYLIESLKHQGAKIAIWGVGTKLVTAFDQPALGGVYKLSAIRDRPNGAWRHTLKISQQIAKVSFPGILQIRRFWREGKFIADMIFDEVQGGDPTSVLVDPKDSTRRLAVDPLTAHEDLLAPIFRGGVRVCDLPPLAAIRSRALEQIERLHPSIRRFANPHEYPVGLEQSLAELRLNLMRQTRGGGPALVQTAPSSTALDSNSSDFKTGGAESTG